MYSVCILYVFIIPLYYESLLLMLAVIKNFLSFSLCWVCFIMILTSIPCKFLPKFPYLFYELFHFRPNLQRYFLNNQLVKFRLNYTTLLFYHKHTRNSTKYKRFFLHSIISIMLRRNSSSFKSMAISPEYFLATMRMLDNPYPWV